MTRALHQICALLEPHRHVHEPRADSRHRSRRCGGSRDLLDLLVEEAPGDNGTTSARTRSVLGRRLPERRDDGPALSGGGAGHPPCAPSRSLKAVRRSRRGGSRSWSFTLNESRSRARKTRARERRVQGSRKWFTRAAFGARTPSLGSAPYPSRGGCRGAGRGPPARPVQPPSHDPAGRMAVAGCGPGRLTCRGRRRTLVRGAGVRTRKRAAAVTRALGSFIAASSASPYRASPQRPSPSTAAARTAARGCGRGGRRTGRGSLP